MNFETSIRVRYEETDRMGVVYHTNYLVYFEVARTELLRELGCRYRDLEAAGYLLAVIDCQARFLQSAEYDDLLILRPQITAFKGARITISYGIYREETLIVEGQTSHAVLERSSFRPCRLPENLRLALEKATKED